MARRRSSNNFYSTQRESLNSTARVLNLLSSLKPIVSPFGDRRLYHPLGAFRPADVVGRRIARSLVLKKAKDYVPTSNTSLTHMPVDRLVFREPWRVMICARRAMRREVMFALNKTGKGSGSRRSRNWFSDISCKR